jgi:hypothetical protein
MSIKHYPARLIAQLSKSSQFTYINCLDRSYSEDENCVFSVQFLVSRYGEHQCVLHFSKAVSEAQAIHATEAYLSLPMDKKHFNTIHDDLFLSDSRWTDFCYRGDALSDCKFLEAVYLSKNGQLSFSFGS